MSVNGIENFWTRLNDNIAFRVATVRTRSRKPATRWNAWPSRLAEAGCRILAQGRRLEPPMTATWPG